MPTASGASDYHSRMVTYFSHTGIKVTGQQRSETHSILATHFCGSKRGSHLRRPLASFPSTRGITQGFSDPTTASQPVPHHPNSHVMGPTPSRGLIYFNPLLRQDYFSTSQNIDTAIPSTRNTSPRTIYASHLASQMSPLNTRRCLNKPVNHLLWI